MTTNHTTTSIHPWQRPATDEEMRSAIAQSIAEYGNCGPYCTGDCQVDGTGQACPDVYQVQAETTERIAEYQAIIAEAYEQQAEHYRGAEYAAAMGLIRAAMMASLDGAEVLARIADVLAALDAVRDAAHREWESTR